MIDVALSLEETTVVGKITGYKFYGQLQAVDGCLVATARYNSSRSPRYLFFLPSGREDIPFSDADEPSNGYSLEYIEDGH